MPNGYNGKILHVDLTKGTLEVEEPKESFYRKYLGGSAMGMYYILRDMPKGTDPIGPDNVLTLMAGVTNSFLNLRQARTLEVGELRNDSAHHDQCWRLVTPAGLSR